MIRATSARWLLAATAASRPFKAAIRLLEAVDNGRPNVVAVLTYHRVGGPTSVAGYPGLISATTSEFTEQMGFLATRYRVASMADLIDAREGRRDLPPRSVMVTFDDAYRDFAEYAWPVLHRLKLPVTLFVPTAFPGQAGRAFWWDWLYVALRDGPAAVPLATPAGTFRLGDRIDRAQAFRLLRAEVKSLPDTDAMQLVAHIAGQLGVERPSSSVLDWPELRALAAEGVTMAPHSREHPLLDRIGASRLVQELRGSWDDLRSEIGATLPVLAYPSGSHSDLVRETARRIGFRAAFTTRRGINSLGQADWLSLRRINVGRSSTLSVLRAQLGRWALLWSR